MNNNEKNEENRILKKKARQQEIRNDPSVIISKNEYLELPQNEKNNWVGESAGNQIAQITVYKRKIKESINLKTRLTENEYSKLSKVNKNLGWIKMKVDDGIPGSSFFHVMYRRRFKDDNMLDALNKGIKELELTRKSFLKTYGTSHNSEINIHPMFLPKNGFTLENSPGYYILNSNKSKEYIELGKKLNQYKKRYQKIKKNLNTEIL